MAFALGLSDQECEKIKAGRLIQLSQQLIRDPSGLSPDDRRRRRARKPILKRRYEAQQGGAKEAIKWARKQIGVTEHPKGSNWGHPVQDWITFTGYGGPESLVRMLRRLRRRREGRRPGTAANPARPRHRHQ